MSEDKPATATPVLRNSRPRLPAARLGVAVVHDLVETITRGDLQPGDALPPEEKLAQHFAVSRTVIRESVKRVEEKGLIDVAPGRGTIVRPKSSWNVLDPVVLAVLLENDSTLGVLDEIAVIRASLEGAMSAATARHHTQEQAALVSEALHLMEKSLDDPDAFAEADLEFHFLVMTLSENELASNITKILFSRARQSARFLGNQTSEAFHATLDEHRLVHDAIIDGDPAAAESAMRAHILDAWQRRRYPTARER